MSVTPLTFLVVSGGEVRLMNINGTNVSSESAIVNTISDIVDKSPAIFAKIKSYFKKDSAENQEDAAPAEESQVKE